eukprot:6491855-Amphidinium_carterae.1
MEESLPDFDGDMKAEQHDAPLSEAKAEEAGDVGLEAPLIDAKADVHESDGVLTVSVDVKADTEAGMQQDVQASGSADQVASAATEQSGEQMPEGVSVAVAQCVPEVNASEPRDHVPVLAPAEEQHMDGLMRHKVTVQQIVFRQLEPIVWERQKLSTLLADDVVTTLSEVREGVYKAWANMVEHYPSSTRQVWLEVWHSTCVGKKRYNERTEFILKQFRACASANLAKSQKCLQSVYADMVAAQQSLTPVWKTLQSEVPKSRAREAWEALLVAVALPSKTECETDFAEKKATGMFAETCVEQEGTTAKNSVPPPPLPSTPMPPPPPAVRVAADLSGLLAQRRAPTTPTPPPPPMLRSDEAKAGQDVGAKAPWRVKKTEVPSPPPRPGGRVQVPMPPPPSAKHGQRGSSSVPTLPPPPRRS